MLSADETNLPCKGDFPSKALLGQFCVSPKQLALSHPNLDCPIFYVENQALLPHLNFLWQPQPLDSALKKLEAGMGRQNSQRITALLCRRGVLESIAWLVSQRSSPAINTRTRIAILCMFAHIRDAATELK